MKRRIQKLIDKYYQNRERVLIEGGNSLEELVKNQDAILAMLSSTDKARWETSGPMSEGRR